MVVKSCSPGEELSTVLICLKKQQISCLQQSGNEVRCYDISTSVAVSAYALPSALMPPQISLAVMQHHHRPIIALVSLGFACWTVTTKEWLSICQTIRFQTVIGATIHKIGLAAVVDRARCIQEVSGSRQVRQSPVTGASPHFFSASSGRMACASSDGFHI